MSTRPQRRQISDIMIDQGLVERDSMMEALNIQNTTGETLGAILVDMGCITSPDIAKLMCAHFQLPFIRLSNYDYDAKLLSLFKPEFLHKHKILPLDSIGPMLLCAFIEVPSEQVLNEIPRHTKRKVAFVVAEIQEIDKVLLDRCPLSADSELLKRRQHIQPIKKQGETGKTSSGAPIYEQTSEQIAEALDSTWDSIFDSSGGEGESES